MKPKTAWAIYFDGKLSMVCDEDRFHGTTSWFYPIFLAQIKKVIIKISDEANTKTMYVCEDLS